MGIAHFLSTNNLTVELHQPLEDEHPSVSSKSMNVNETLQEKSVLIVYHLCFFAVPHLSYSPLHLSFLSVLPQLLAAQKDNYLLRPLMKFHKRENN